MVFEPGSIAALADVQNRTQVASSSDADLRIG